VAAFELDYQEIIRRGIEIKVLECEELLTMTIHFFYRIRVSVNLLPYLEVRDMIAVMPEL
jgi:hypothetical protein